MCINEHILNEYVGLAGVVEVAADVALIFRVHDVNIFLRVTQHFPHGAPLCCRHASLHVGREF